MTPERGSDGEGAGTGTVAMGGRLLARNTLLNVLGQALPLLFGLAAIPYVIEGLGVDRFGLLTLCWVLLGYLGVLHLGVGPAVTKFAAEILGRGALHELPPLFRTAAWFSAALGVVGAGILAAAAPLLASRVFRLPPEIVPDARAVFLLLSLSVPFLFLSGAFRGFLAAAQRFDLVNLVSFVSSSLNFVIPAVGVATGHGLPWIVAGVVSVRIAATGALYACCRGALPLGGARARFERSRLAPLLRFGGWIALSGAMNPLLHYLERILIGAVLSVGLLTYYATPYEMISRIVVLPASFALTLFPAFSYHGETNRGAVEDLFLRSFRWLLFLMVPVGALFVAFGGELLRLWLGAEFAARSATLFRILSVSFFLHAFAYGPVAVVQGLGRPDWKAKLDLFEVPFFLLVLLVSMRAAGLEGAAFAKLVITIVDVTALSWFARRLLGTRFGALWDANRSLAAIGLGYVVVVTLLALSPLPPAWSLAAAVVVAAPYAALFLRFGADDRDRSALRAFRARLFGGRKTT